MTTNLIWISAVDHRISAAIVFFILMLLLNTGKRRSLFVLRAAAVLASMCLCSWLLRSLSDEWLGSLHLRALCYSAQTMALHLLFVWGCFFCYKTNPAEAWYNGLLGLTIFKIAWNVFKAGASLLLINDMNAPWGQYSILGSLVSYIVYLAVCLVFWLQYKKLVHEPPYHAPVRMMATLTAVFVSLQMVLDYCGHVFTAEKNALFLYYLCALLYTVLNYATLLMIAELDSFRHENRTMHDFISNKMRYYEMSHDGIVALQTKCHDLKHQILAIRSEAGKARFNDYLDELENSINEYSTVVECGHPTIDIVLTEKNILCYSNQVKFSYMVDGFPHRTGDLLPVWQRAGQRPGSRRQNRGSGAPADYPEERIPGRHGGPAGGKHLRGRHESDGGRSSPDDKNRLRPRLRAAVHTAYRRKTRRHHDPAYGGRRVQNDGGHAAPEGLRAGLPAFPRERQRSGRKSARISDCGPCVGLYKRQRSGRKNARPTAYPQPA